MSLTPLLVLCSGYSQVALHRPDFLWFGFSPEDPQGED
jgi:hypothetical protein